MNTTSFTEHSSPAADRQIEFRPVLGESHFSLRLMAARDQAVATEASLTLIALKLRASVESAAVDVATFQAILEEAPRSAEIGALRDGRIGVLMGESRGPASGDVQDFVHELAVHLPAVGIEIYEYCGTEASENAACEYCVTDLPLGESDLDGILEFPTPLWKRILDLSLAATGLILLTPLLLLVAGAVKVLSRGPVLYSQRRAGLAGKPFQIWKFRTMVVDADQHRAALKPLSQQDGPAFKIADDPRITSVGRWLRRLSIDELPQLLNVLKGEMSLVGPRPLPCDESDQCEAWQRRRLCVLPGITCYWQVADRGDPIPFDEWMRMDLKYLQTRSFATDLMLLWKTLLFVVGLRGC